MTTTTTKKSSAWDRLEAKLAAFTAAKREAEEVRVRRSAATREVSKAEAELRRVYSEPDEDREAVAAARVALNAAREEAEVAVWEGKTQRAQDAADLAGGEVERHALDNLSALIGELANEEKASREELGERWGALREAVDRADAVERKMLDLARLLGVPTDAIGEHELAPVLRTAGQAGVRVRSPEEWPSRMPARWLPEPAGADT